MSIGSYLTCDRVQSTGRSRRHWLERISYKWFKWKGMEQSTFPTLRWSQQIKPWHYDFHFILWGCLWHIYLITCLCFGFWKSECVLVCVCVYFLFIHCFKQIFGFIQTQTCTHTALRQTETQFPSWLIWIATCGNPHLLISLFSTY